MKSKLELFHKHKKSITERIIGSVIQHFVYRHTGQRIVTHDAMKAISRTVKTREEFRDYLQDTINKTEYYFTRGHTDETYSDHQCRLVTSIYRDYSRMKV